MFYKIVFLIFFSITSNYAHSFDLKKLGDSLNKELGGKLKELEKELNKDVSPNNETQNNQNKSSSQDRVKKKDRDKYYQKDTLSVGVKTGYGALKLLEKIVERSQGFCEDGKPMRLYFFNLQANESYWVEIMDFSKNMSLENNAMWNWNITMKAIGQVPDTYNGKSNINNLLTYAAVQKSLNQTFSNLTVGGASRATEYGLIGG